MSEELRDEILRELKEIKDAIKQNKDNITALDEALRGNLKDRGWLGRIEKVEECVDNTKKLVFGAVLATVGSITTAIFQALKHN
jgi:uncharacterized protein Yka (UPF0111/DUF47 family)